MVSADAALRDLARLRAAMALADTATPADLEARLKDFDAAGNPWRHVAREMMAAALWRAKDYAGADKQVQAILGRWRDAGRRVAAGPGPRRLAGSRCWRKNDDSSRKFLCLAPWLRRWPVAAPSTA